MFDKLERINVFIKKNRTSRMGLEYSMLSVFEVINKARNLMTYTFF